MSASLTVRPSRSEPQIDWTMKRSAPRIDSRVAAVDLAVGERLQAGVDRARRSSFSAIFAPSSRLARPAVTISRFS